MVVEDIIWRQPVGLRDGLYWLDTAVRMIGNYKCMAGFMMVTAYVDSGFAHATRFSIGDLVVFLTYMQMIWILDPLVYTICSSATPDLCYATETRIFNEFVGVHRWYLLLMIFIKVALCTFRVCKLPPIAQCVIVNGIAFNLPSQIGCLTDRACLNSVDPKAWISLRPALQPLLQFIFMGAYEDAWNMFSSVFMRYYVLFAVMYFWTFHYGRPALHWTAARLSRASLPPTLKRAHSATVSKMQTLSSTLGEFSGRFSSRSEDEIVSAGDEEELGPPRSRSLKSNDVHSDGEIAPVMEADAAETVVQESPSSPVQGENMVGGLPASSANGSTRPDKAPFEPKWMLPAAAGVALLAVELINAGSVGPHLYFWMQEDAMGTQTPQLLPTIGVFVMLTLAVFFLLGVAVCVRKPSRAVQLAGSTTLGTYVLHMYFTLLLTKLQPNFAAIPSTIQNSTLAISVQMLFIILTPMAFQLTIGAAFHKLLMLEFRAVFSISSSIWKHCTMRARAGNSPDLVAPYSRGALNPSRLGSSHSSAVELTNIRLHSPGPSPRLNDPSKSGPSMGDSSNAEPSISSNAEPSTIGRRFGRAPMKSPASDVLTPVPLANPSSGAGPSSAAAPIPAPIGRASV